MYFMKNAKDKYDEKHCTAKYAWVKSEMEQDYKNTYLLATFPSNRSERSLFGQALLKILRSELC